MLSGASVTVGVGAALDEMVAGGAAVVVVADAGHRAARVRVRVRVRHWTRWSLEGRRWWWWLTLDTGLRGMERFQH